LEAALLPEPVAAPEDPEAADVPEPAAPVPDPVADDPPGVVDPVEPRVAAEPPGAPADPATAADPASVGTAPDAVWPAASALPPATWEEAGAALLDCERSTLVPQPMVATVTAASSATDR
jgi:hypothetical protein